MNEAQEGANFGDTRSYLVGAGKEDIAVDW